MTFHWSSSKCIWTTLERQFSCSSCNGASLSGDRAENNLSGNTTHPTSLLHDVLCASTVALRDRKTIVVRGVQNAHRAPLNKLQCHAESRHRATQRLNRFKRFSCVLIALIILQEAHPRRSSRGDRLAPHVQVKQRQDDTTPSVQQTSLQFIGPIALTALQDFSPGESVSRPAFQATLGVLTVRISLSSSSKASNFSAGESVSRPAPRPNPNSRTVRISLSPSIPSHSRTSHRAKVSTPARNPNRQASLSLHYLHQQLRQRATSTDHHARNCHRHNNTIDIHSKATAKRGRSHAILATTTTHAAMADHDQQHIPYTPPNPIFKTDQPGLCNDKAQIPRPEDGQSNPTKTNQKMQRHTQTHTCTKRKTYTHIRTRTLLLQTIFNCFEVRRTSFFNSKGYARTCRKSH